MRYHLLAHFSEDTRPLTEIKLWREVNEKTQRRYNCSKADRRLQIKINKECAKAKRWWECSYEGLKEQILENAIRPYSKRNEVRFGFKDD